MADLLKTFPGVPSSYTLDQRTYIGRGRGPIILWLKGYRRIRAEIFGCTDDAVLVTLFVYYSSCLGKHASEVAIENKSCGGTFRHSASECRWFTAHLGSINQNIQQIRNLALVKQAVLPVRFA